MYELTDQQLALQELAREFAREQVRPVAKDRDADPDLAKRFPWEVLDQASQLGLRTLALPSSEGGAGLDVLTQCLVFEELAYGDVGFATTLDRTWRLSGLLTLTDATRATLLPAFKADGRMLLALAGGGSVTAQRRAGGWTLDGESAGVVAGGIAGLLFVEAGDGSGRTSLFAVKPGQSGFRAEAVDKAGRRLEPMADIALSGYAAAQGDLVGAEGEAAKVAAGLSQRFAPATAMGAVAVGRSAYDLAVDWAYRRIQGGKPIYQHPAVAMKLGDMYVALEASRALALHAAWATDRGLDSAESLAKAATVLSAQAANRVCYDSMQVWGGMGFMREGGMEKFTRDAIGFTSEGQIDALREQLGHIAVARIA